MLNKLTFNVKKAVVERRLISIHGPAGKAPCLTTNPWDLKAWQREMNVGLRVSCSDGP